LLKVALNTKTIIHLIVKGMTFIQYLDSIM
jgi:hypothetical protein